MPHLPKYVRFIPWEVAVDRKLEEILDAIKGLEKKLDDHIGSTGQTTQIRETEVNDAEL